MFLVDIWETLRVVLEFNSELSDPEVSTLESLT